MRLATDYALQIRGRAALYAEFSEMFKRYLEFGVDRHRLLVGDRHWTLTFQPAQGSRRGFRALDVVEIDDEGPVTRKDTFFGFAKVKPAMEGA